MPKFKSSIKVGGIESLTGNTTLLHLGTDNRVGIGTTAPETKLHVDGAITATGLVVPAGILSAQGDSATVFGFNPNFSEWNGAVANGYIQTDGGGIVEQSSDSNLGGSSARFNDTEAIWTRRVPFSSPLYANVFIQGTMTYKYEGHTTGEPGLAVTLTHRAKGDADDTDDVTFVVPTYDAVRGPASDWQTVPWRAYTPPNREITHLKIQIVSTAGGIAGTNDGGGGTATTLGGGIDYDWYLDGFDFSFMHPDLRIDQQGRITGAYIAYAAIDDAHIKNMISSTSSRIYSDGGLLTDGLVANSSHANGWSLQKTGLLKARDIEIYGPKGTVLISTGLDVDGRENPFFQWTDRSLSHIDPAASTYLYGLAFEESNKSQLRANVGFLAESGLSSATISANDHSVYFANTITGPTGGLGSNLANGVITFNGMSSNAPPGSIVTGVDINVIKNQDAYIMFLANTQKWDTNIGAKQEYHANTLLGEHGLYVLGTPTVGGWLYHPHGNNTWYTIDSEQSGNRLHENDFLVIGRIATDSEGKIRIDKTFVQPPKHPDSITSPEAQGSYPPIGITAGGVLFADIHLNQWEHTANAGEIQFTNQRNNPNTRFTFIHPGTNDPSDSTMYTVNGASGVLTSLEDFPGSRYITFIGAAKDRAMPGGGTGFTFDYEGHSPDFVAAFPLGSKWFYNQDEGKYSEFTPESRDCIVARVDANGSVGELTNIYRYAEREWTTSEGGVLSDLIINPPSGMSSGGLVFSDLTINKEFQKSDNTFIANSGFVAFSNPENNPRNEFYVIHPDNGNTWLVDSVGRGVATSLNPTNDVYGTRHIAFVGGSTSVRFPAISSHYNVANDFIAVSERDSQGNLRDDGKWYYDPGTGISTDHVFTPIANDFIIATLNSYDPTAGEEGIDQISRWAAKEGSLVVDGVEITVSSVRNLLNSRIDVANTTAQTALSEAQSAYANAVTAQANVAQALGLLDGRIEIFFEVEGADGGKYANNESHSDFSYNDLWINTSGYNEAIDGSWYTNAIFRYSNSTYGFDPTLAWHHDSTNPTGRAYLGTLEARGFADKAAIVFYEDRSADLYPFYGPNVASLLSGESNWSPGGDLWYDTRSLSADMAPSNHPYVYRTNTAFASSNNSHGFGYITTGTGAWAQTVHNVGLSGTWSSTAQTGWWSLQDSSAGDAAAGIAAEAAAREDAIDLEAANRENAIATSLAAAEAFAQSAADREILAFFTDSTDTPPTSTGNGDIWIHTDNAIDTTTGTMNTGSVFIANTTSSGYGAGSINPPERFWNQSPNNAIGRSFLEGYVSAYSANSIAYTALATGNGKIVAHFSSHWPIGSGAGKGTHGPLPNTTPSGLENPEPHGDFWINTSNNNLVFIYHQNNTINYAQTAYFNVTPENNLGAGSNPLSGWYSTEDPRTVNALAASYDALSDAATAQAAADKEILAYFQAGTPTASGNGDIWIATASYATLNSSSIYVAFTAGAESIAPGEWVQSPNSAIGLVYLNAYLSDKKASRAESLAFNITGFSNNFPIYPDANGIYVGATGNVAFYKNSKTEYLQDQSLDNHGAIYATSKGSDLVGPNGKIWNPYSTGFGIPEVGFIHTAYGHPTDDQTVTNSTYSSAYLMYTNMNASTRFLPSESGKTFGEHDHFIPVVWDNLKYDGGGSWRVQTKDGVFFDFAPDSANGDFIVAQLSRPEANPEGLADIDSFVFRTLPVQTQSITDGKIVTHFGVHWPYTDPADSGDGTHGPQANVTPTGLANPEPHGDFWINTANNNLVFRYHSNTTNKYAQTVYYSTVVGDKAGWYSTEDPRTANNEQYASNTYVWLANTHNWAANLQYDSSNNAVWINFALANAQFANGVAFNANAAAYFAQAAADREILAFFVPYTGTVPDASGNGDVWIQTDNAIDTYGAVNAVAIFSANTNSSGGTGDGTSHFWHSSPNNAIGLIYLNSYAEGRIVSDDKQVVHYDIHYPTTPGIATIYGPQANTTPTGRGNPQPHGDLWIDTSNNNIMFRYHQKDPSARVFHVTESTFAQTAIFATATSTSTDGWYALDDPRIANNEAYSANAQIWLTNIDGNVFTLNVASANAQLFINFAFANIAFVNGTAYNAQAAADLAQAAADREILAYFQIHSDVPEATGNGDVWIHTDNLIKTSDGTLNTAAIYSANTKLGGIPDAGLSGAHFWYESPNNAIGLMYARSYASGVGGSFDRGSNIMPRGWSLFDAPSEEYSNASSLVDVVPYPISPNAGFMWEIVDDQSPPVGGKTLYLKKVVNFSDHGFWATPLGPDTPGGWNDQTIPIPYGKRWILSWYAKNAAGTTVGIDSGIWAFLGNTSISTGKGYASSRGTAEGGTQNFVGTGWERHWFMFDLTGGSDGTGTFADAGFIVGGDIKSTDRANGVNRIIMRSDPGGWKGETSVADSPTYYAGFQLEEVPSDVHTPSKFKEPSDNKAIIFGKEISDGKVVTQFYDTELSGPWTHGPQANVTPTGLPNPEPHGDMFVDTGNNNVMFRYNQKIPSARAFDADHSTFAQTITWSAPTSDSADGWYAMADPRTSNTENWLGTVERATTDAAANAEYAIQQAAFAASAADAEILVFFEPTGNADMYLSTKYGGAGNREVKTGPATGNGDLWIQVDQVYDEDGNQNTASIFFANLSPGSGASDPAPGWTESPYNAIGRAFLEKFTSTGVKNWFPSGYSTWDEHPDKYNIAFNTDDAHTPFPLHLQSAASVSNTSVNTTFGKVSDGSLQLIGGDADDGQSERPLVNFANNSSYKRKHIAGTRKQTMQFPRGKRWIFSYYAYSNSALAVTTDPRPEVHIWFDDTIDPTSNLVKVGKISTFSARNKWERFSHVLDFSNTAPNPYVTASSYDDKWDSWNSTYGYETQDTSGALLTTFHDARLANLNSMFVRLDFNQGTDTDSHILFDGFQFEEAPGQQMLAGPFSDPDRRINDDFDKALSDGKIVTYYVPGYPPGGSQDPYYGPRANVTPSGVPNLAPHGDFWVDTANNNALYRYHQNSSTTGSITTSGQTAFWSTIAYQDDLLGYTPSGWYSIADGRIEILTTDVATAFTDLADQLTRIQDVEAASDGELQILFEPEGGNFGNAVNTYVGAYYGDLWINTKDYNTFANGTLSTNAVFRWQNSVSGFTEYIADLESGTNAPKGLAWRHAPNNAIGQVYLSSWAAQNTSDQRVTAYFMGGNKTGEGFFGPPYDPSLYKGPQTNTTPSGRYNANPDGDIWIDTSNNNVMHVYHYNSGVHSAGFEQRIYYSSSPSPEGWYSAEDLRVGSHQIAFDLAKASGSDRHVQIFYEIDAPTTSTGNGDIWIDTTAPLLRDGNANTLSIYIANTTAGGYGSAGGSRYWNLDQTSALGRSALDGYNADQKSARSELMSLITVGDSSLAGSIPFPLYPAANGIMGVGASGNVKFHTPSDIHDDDPAQQENPGEIDVINNGGIPFIGPDGIERILNTAVRPGPHTVYSGTFSSVFTDFDNERTTTDANTSYIMYTSTTASSRFGSNFGDIGNLIHVCWADDYNTWIAINNVRNEYPFVPDADEGDFLVAKLRRPAGSGLTVESWITNELPAQTRKYSDGKTVYFISNTFHGSTAGLGDHAYGPDPSTTQNGLTNPEPYGDKWISISPPYKTYLYFSNSSNKIAQTAFHHFKSRTSSMLLANTSNYPFDLAGNNASGWYEYRDTGDALTQQGYQVALGQIAIKDASWTENGQNVLDNITFNDDTVDGTAPSVIVTNTGEFGENKELLLNPVPPPDQNLHAHWTFNSMGVDPNGTRYIPDVSGRKNHATVHEFDNNQEIFSPHDPAADKINVSGNHSLYSDGGGDTLAGGIVLAVDGSVSQTILSDGTRVPLDISDATLFMKQTITMWYNPGDVTTMASYERILSRHYVHHYLFSPHTVSEAFGPDGDERSLKLYRYGDTESPRSSGAINLINSFSAPDGRWFGPPSTTEFGDDRDKRGALKSHTWHFFSLSFDYALGNIELWIYREGEGLIWHDVMNFFTGSTPSPGGIANYQVADADVPRLPRAIKLLESSSSADGQSGASRAQGYIDEVRLYNQILTPRNIRYLYMNPTGRPRQLQPRPGLAVKKNHESFMVGYPSVDISGSTRINSFAYFHGFDIDGNPADVDPYVSEDGNVKFIKKGVVKADFGSIATRQNYEGNTFYIMYNDVNDGTLWSGGGSSYYAICQPVGNTADNPSKHTWRRHNWDNSGTPWLYFTPDEEYHFVVGEGRFANIQEQGSADTIGAAYLKNLKAYQFSRNAETIRESYNFTLTPQDFIDSGGIGSHFFANADFWTDDKLAGIYIKDASIGSAQILELAADRIQAGQISVRITVGDNPDHTVDKILLDGTNSRIVISD